MSATKLKLINEKSNCFPNKMNEKEFSSDGLNKIS